MMPTAQRKQLEAMADAISALAVRMKQDGAPGPLVLLAMVAATVKLPRALDLDAGLAGGFLTALAPLIAQGAEFPYTRFLDMLQAIAEDTDFSKEMEN